jgi:hypothetical protein
MTDQQFRALLDLFMCSDPWPVSPEIEYFNSRDIILSLLDEEAKKRGCRDWIDAYHNIRHK